MTENKQDDILHDVLGQVAYQMNKAMDTMYSAFERIAPKEVCDADKTLDENAAMVRSNFFRLRRLSANLEEVANLDAPSLSPLKDDDIIGLCAAVTDRAQHAAELLGLRLEFKSERSSCIIALNAKRIERLLLNLLSNAFKFTPAGGVVTVEVRVLLRQVELRVRDTGCGISREKMEHLFDRYRSMNCPDGTPRGLGLGLPICRKIAQDHGGTLLVQSTEGQGTTVIVSLEHKKTRMITMNTFVKNDLGGLKPLEQDYTGGFNPTLLELSDALPRQAFESNMMD